MEISGKMEQPSQHSQPKVNEDEESDWSLSSVEVKDLMQAEEDQDLDELPSKVSVSLNDDMSQMSRIPFPDKPQIKKNVGIFKIGRLMTFVNEFMVVESTDVMVLDFDNYVFDKDKRMLGFVADVFGPVEKPYYAIRLQSTQIIPTLQVGQPIFFSEGSRLIGKEVISTLKTPGTDAVGDNNSQSEDEDEVKSEKGPIKRRYEPTTNQQQPRARRNNPHHSHHNSVPEIYRTHNQQHQQQKHTQQHNQQYQQPQQIYGNQMPMQYQPNPVPYMPSMQYPMSQHPLAQHPVPPPMSNVLNPEQQMYLQGIYKQYYDQMMHFYSNTK